VCDGADFGSGREASRGLWLFHWQGERQSHGPKSARPEGLWPERPHAALLGLRIGALFGCAERLACDLSGHNASREIKSDRLLVPLIFQFQIKGLLPAIEAGLSSVESARAARLFARKLHP
jgi:hypothetical protein